MGKEGGYSVESSGKGEDGGADANDLLSLVLAVMRSLLERSDLRLVLAGRQPRLANSDVASFRLRRPLCNGTRQLHLLRSFVDTLSQDQLSLSHFTGPITIYRMTQYMDNHGLLLA